jgi:asparagine synthase (glutamine-hydrolysing)
MCGIAGVFNTKTKGKENVGTMVEKIGYRGIDERGVHQIGPAILGHVRLNVVDPENGKQPMSNEDGTVWVSFNGEIYNYIELREELKAKGHKFKSRCDTEVLVHLWEEEGEKMLERLIGMYAFFVWDEKKKRGMLARDRQGIKPCYYSEYDGGIAFCSEIKGILSLPKFTKKINKDTLLQMFTLNYPPPPQTCFEGVQHLMPGHYMLFEESQKPVIKSYWQWPLFAEKRLITHDEFSSMMDDSLRLQLRFDVPGGLFLSGGVDSSIVAHHLSKSWSVKNFDALGLDFEVSGFSEYTQAKLVAGQVGAHISPLTISASEIPEIAAKVGYHSDQPHGDFSFYLFYLLSKKAHSMNKIVMFNGDGPDEALLGFGHNQNYFSRLNFSMKSYFDLITYMNSEMRQKLLTEEFLKGTTDPYEKFENVLAPWADLDPIEQISAYELTCLMPGNNLIKGDRMGAAWSIEGRAPLLDHRISEAFVKLPTSEKLKNGIGKSYLKEYALRYFTKEMIYKDKKMPTMPIGEWVKNELYTWAKDLFMSSPDDGIFNQNEILAMLEEHRENKRNNTQQIRTILMTKIWLKNFF